MAKGKEGLAPFALAISAAPARKQRSSLDEEAVNRARSACLRFTPLASSITCRISRRARSQPLW
jgi:hypothetical protein